MTKKQKAHEDLARAVGWLVCDAVHHERRDQHTYDVPCPVLERLRAALKELKP